MMYTLSFFSGGGPGIPGAQSHILCADQAEQKALINYYAILSSEFKPLVRMLDGNEDREDVPFVVHPDNACSLGPHIRFYRVEKWYKDTIAQSWAPDHLHAILAELCPTEFMAIYAEKTGRSSSRVVATY